ncbi:MAG: glycosyltransferase [Pseudomonadota bacterium]
MTMRRFSIGVVLGSVTQNAGGLFTSVRRSAQELQRAGHRVTIYAPGLREDVDTFGDWAPLVPQLFPPVGPAPWGFARGLGRALRAGNHDVIHQHGIWQGFSASVRDWGRRTGGPVVIAPRGMLSTWALSRSRAKKRVAALAYERANLAQAACLQALTAAEANEIANVVPGARIEVIGNGVDPAPPRLDSRACQEPKGLLFLGRLHPKKGLEQLISAWGQVASFCPGWELRIAGWGAPDYSARLRTMARNARAPIVFLGPVFGAEKAATLASASAFVLPSASEGQPIAALEAWAAGLPTLLTEACHLPEGRAAGASLPLSADPAELARDLRAALVRPDLAEIGARGRALVARAFSWDGVARQHADLYARLLDRDPRVRAA